MAGTRTAPTVDGSPTYNTLTIYFIDTTGDLSSESFRFDSGASAATIEALIVAWQDMTQSSIYRVDVTDVYRGAQDKSNASALARAQASQGINNVFRNTTTFVADTYRIVAPVDALFIPQTDTIDGSVALWTTWAAALLAVIPPTVDWESAGYTERKSTNKKTRI